ncbi:MAG TPA: 4-phosphoerythronate dehydrogenase [Chitinivibrionales bacterium]|nr:4-phosphoerythronate dehydrogenase [Chitinivibrionales bacterium]
MKILADSNIPFAAEAFAQFGDVVTIEGRSITREKLRNIDVLLARSVILINRELLEDTAVKYVATATSGIDHIDVSYLRGRNIGFSHAPGSNAESVAEYVVSALVHCAHEMNIKLNGMTLGVIGVGKVGRRVIHLCQALGIRCLLNDPPIQRRTGGKDYLPLSKLLDESDIISLHVPLSFEGRDATFRMVNEEFISSMKKGALFINTSRGDVVDESALKKRRERLGCVVLDVWSNEPEPSAATIAICDIATPHIAGHSFDGKLLGTKMIYEAACDYFKQEVKWHGHDMRDNEKPVPILVSKSDNVIREVINRAYPIMEDDRNFRKIIRLDIPKRADFFSGLRNNYYKRLEFCNHTFVVRDDNAENDASVLKKLGFKMEIK